MKKILLILIILFVSVMTTACVNNIAIRELNNKADDYMTKGDTETAICRLKASLDLDSEVVDTHYKLAVAYNNLARYEEAITEINKVLSLNPDYAPAYYTLGLTKEILAYQISSNDVETLSIEDLSLFNTTAQEAVDAFNSYLIKDVKATDVSEVNNKISSLNAKIKEFTEIYDLRVKERGTIEVQEISQEEQQETQENHEEIISE